MRRPIVTPLVVTRFSRFPTMFSKGVSPRVVKSQDCVVKSQNKKCKKGNPVDLTSIFSFPIGIKEIIIFAILDLFVL